LIVLFMLAVLGSTGNDHTQSAKEMLSRLWHTARERADDMHKKNKAASPDNSYIPSSAETFAGILDYVRDKVKRPPLLSVEQNLIMLLNNTQVLAEEIQKLRKTIEQAPSKGLDAVLDSQLISVQGPKYTIINKQN